MVRPLLNAEVVRLPAFGTNGSQTGAIVDPVTQVVILTESSIEKKLVRSLMADRNVVNVDHQAFLIQYTDANGDTKHHTVDIVATLRDGTRIGYVVKPEATAIKQELRGLVERMATFVQPADLAVLQMVTSRNLPEWGNLNARMLANSRRDRRTYIDDLLRDSAPDLLRPICIGDLTDRLGGGAIAFRPVLRAIYHGTLDFLSHGVIGEESKVNFSGQIMPDTDLDIPPPDILSEAPPVILRRKREPRPVQRASYRSN